MFTSEHAFNREPRNHLVHDSLGCIEYCCLVLGREDDPALMRSLFASGEIRSTQWRTLIAAMLGWMLDGLDVMLYSFALLSMQKEFGLTGAQAGMLTTVTLAAAAVGGTLAGVFADRYGRTKVLMASILTYSIFTAMIATSHSLTELLIWRLLVGLGLGAEWPAGSVLVAETWPAAFVRDVFDGRGGGDASVRRRGAGPADAIAVGAVGWIFRTRVFQRFWLHSE